MSLNKLHGWVFTYNSLSDIWMGAKSEHSKDLTNDFNSPNIIKAKNFETLQAVIIKTGGNKTKLANLTK